MINGDLKMRKKTMWFLVAVMSVGMLFQSCSDDNSTEPESGNKAPACTLTSPGDDDVIMIGSDITLSATASDEDGTVESVKFYQNDNLLATDADAPYSFKWNTAGAVSGDVTLKAVAVDNEGAQTASSVGVSLEAPAEQIVTLTPGIELLDKAVLYIVQGGGYISGDVTIGEDVVVVFETSLILDSGRLSIAAGAHLSFKEGKYIEIDDGGSIVIAGTADKKVILTNEDAGTYWGYSNGTTMCGGIYIENNAATTNSITYAVISNATTGLTSERENGLTVSNSEFKDCQYYGIHYRGDKVIKKTQNEALSSSTFSGCGKGDVLTNASNMIYFKNDLNQDKGIFVDGYIADEEGTWPSLKYVFVDYVIIESKEVTIEAGAYLSFKENAYIRVDDEGSINIAGTEKDKVILTNEDAGTYWGYSNGTTMCGGIYIESDAATTNSITYAVISNATTGLTSERENGLTVSNSEFKDCQYYGIHYRGDKVIKKTQNEALSSSTFSGCGKGDVLTNASNMIYFKNDLNQDKGIFVDGYIADEEGTWPSLKYVFVDYVIIESKEVTIEAGAYLSFKENAYIRVDDEGSINIAGTVENKVTLTNENNGTYWGYSNGQTMSGGIYLASDAATTSTINYAVIENAKTSVCASGSHVVINNCTWGGKEYYHLLLRYGGTAVVDGTEYSIPEYENVAGFNF